MEIDKSVKIYRNKMASASVMLVQPEGELWKKIRVELNEDENTKDQDLTAIKSWLRKQPHLPNEMEDSSLLSFLRGCNFSLEKTKSKIDMYYTMRAACPEFFNNRDITRPEMAALADKAYGSPLPHLTPNGYRVTICKGLDKNLNTEQLNEGIKILMMIGDIRLLEETEGVAGDVYILDASVVTPRHLGSVSLSMLKKFFICAQEAYPVKVKQVHLVNATVLTDTIYNIVKPFLKEKIKKRIYFHKDYTGLHKHFPKELLPEEYDGTGYPLDEINNAWREKLKEYRGWFKEQESLKANEALRPGKPTNYDELFGVEGSFRQLTID